jgi:hypothetical protein
MVYESSSFFRTGSPQPFALKAGLFIRPRFTNIRLLVPATPFFRYTSRKHRWGRGCACKVNSQTGILCAGVAGHAFNFGVSSGPRMQNANSNHSNTYERYCCKFNYCNTHTTSREGRCRKQKLANRERPRSVPALSFKLITLNCLLSYVRVSVAA